MDADALAQLSGPDAALQTDMTLAVAVTRELGVSLDDLFVIEELPAYVSPTHDESFLTEEQTRRVWELLDLQDVRKLSKNEQHELEALVEEESRRFGEYRLRRYAARKGISLEEAQREADEQFTEAVARTNQQDADPHYRQKLIERAKLLRSSSQHEYSLAEVALQIS